MFYNPIERLTIETGKCNKMAVLSFKQTQYSKSHYNVLPVIKGLSSNLDIIRKLNSCCFRYCIFINTWFIKIHFMFTCSKEIKSGSGVAKFEKNLGGIDYKN